MNYGVPWNNYEIVKIISEGANGGIYEIAPLDQNSVEKHSAMIVLPGNSDTIRKEEVRVNWLMNQCCNFYNSLKDNNPFPYIPLIERYCTTNTNDNKDEQYLFVKVELLTPLDRYFEHQEIDERIIVKMGIDICRGIERLEHRHLKYAPVTPDQILVLESENATPVFKFGCYLWAVLAANPNFYKNDWYNIFYIAPEFHDHSSEDKTPGVYSLGMTLYQYLNNGCLPFLTSKNIDKDDILVKTAEDNLLRGTPIPKPQNASDMLATIIMRAIANDPNDRFKNIVELKLALMNYQKMNNIVQTNHKSASSLTLPWKNWSIVRQIGRGGYGKVYEVKNAEGTSSSAVKIIKIPANEDELDSARLTAGYLMETVSEYLDSSFETAKEEISALEKFINHPNIIHLEDSTYLSEYDQEEKITRYTIYMRLEYLQSIRQYYSTRQMTELDILKLGIDISSALKAIESYRTGSGERIFHRDVTPDNILISETTNGRIHFKLNDFGILRKVKSTFTSKFTDVGKPFFMAPELKLGQANTTIDVYSLGMTMYYFLNDNTPPFLDSFNRSDGEAIADAEGLRLNGTQIPVPQNAPAQLSQIVLKAIAYDPSERYQTASEFNRALTEYLKSNPSYLNEYLDISEEE